MPDGAGQAPQSLALCVDEFRVGYPAVRHSRDHRLPHGRAQLPLSQTGSLRLGPESLQILNDSKSLEC